jgi:hypothetical protein
MFRSRYVILKHTYVSTWCNACWWHESDNLHTKPFCLPTHSHLHLTTTTQPTFIPPPTNPPTNLKTTQRPRNHRVRSISRILQHPPLHRPYIAPSITKFGSQKACNLIRKARNGPTKHDISSGYLVRKVCSNKAQKLTRTSQNGKKARNLTWKVCSTTRLTSEGHLITARKKAWNLIAKSRYKIMHQNAYHFIRKSDMNMKKQNAQNPIRKSHYGKNRRQRQTSLTTDYYRPFSTYY